MIAFNLLWALLDLKPFRCNSDLSSSESRICSLYTRVGYKCVPLIISIFFCHLFSDNLLNVNWFSWNIHIPIDKRQVHLFITSCRFQLSCIDNYFCLACWIQFINWWCHFKIVCFVWTEILCVYTYIVTLIGTSFIQFQVKSLWFPWTTQPLLLRLPLTVMLWNHVWGKFWRPWTDPWMQRKTLNSASMALEDWASEIVKSKWSSSKTSSTAWMAQDSCWML